MIDSNELTRKIKTPLNPRAALIAYASEGDKNFFPLIPQHYYKYNFLST